MTMLMHAMSLLCSADFVQQKAQVVLLSGACFKSLSPEAYPEVFHTLETPYVSLACACEPDVTTHITSMSVISTHVGTPTV